MSIYLVDLLSGNRTFMAGMNYACLNFRAVIGFSCLVFFDDHKRHGFQFLICGKTLSADDALTAAANGTVILCRTGINDLRICCAAKWTLQVVFLLCITFIIILNHSGAMRKRFQEMTALRNNNFSHTCKAFRYPSAFLPPPE